ncbi:MAG TPA: sulfurtransferase TusA family protein, partial [Anaerolineales bacterium]|nr:sulfurtransferase TusA family protein [Anaerolineales bacterium]
MASPSPDRHLDCRGLIYPAPILRAEQALREMGEGELLEVLTTDENTKPDLNAWAQRAGAEVLVVTDVVDGVYRFFVRKTRTAAAQETVERGPAPTARL